MADQDPVLAPCPFCSSPHARTYGHPRWGVVCERVSIGVGCGADMPGFATEAEAIAAWNTRPHSPAAPEGSVMELRAKADELARRVIAYVSGPDGHVDPDMECDVELNRMAHAVLMVLEGRAPPTPSGGEEKEPPITVEEHSLIGQVMALLYKRCENARGMREEPERVAQHDAVARMSRRLHFLDGYPGLDATPPRAPQPGVTVEKIAETIHHFTRDGHGGNVHDLAREILALIQGNPHG